MIKKPQTIIIGGGPGGANAAIYLARNCHPVTIIDAPKKIRGRTDMATRLDNYLGNFAGISGPELLRQTGKQLKTLKVETKNEVVLKVDFKNNNFRVYTDEDNTYQAKYLIVAVGMTDNMPEIEGLDSYYDTAIFHCQTCDWYERRNKKIVIVSNDNGGLYNALRMIFYHKPPLISVVPSREDFSYSKKMIDLSQKAGAKIYFSPLAELIGKNGILKKIKLHDKTLVSADLIFTKLGHKHLDDFLHNGNIQVKRDSEGYIKVNPRTFETSCKNLYAVGPCNEMTDQVIVAGGEGALAAFDIDEKILEEFKIKM